MIKRCSTVIYCFVMNENVIASTSHSENLDVYLKDGLDVALLLLLTFYMDSIIVLGSVLSVPSTVRLNFCPNVLQKWRLNLFGCRHREIP